MRISRIHIDRYGLWRNLDLPLDPGGLSVVCGPNEAGKSTLLNFVRGVLYGFPAFETYGRSRAHSFLGGTLHVIHEGRPLEISRRRSDRSAHRLTVAGWERAVPADEMLAEVTAGTTRRGFQTLFALGLPELQQLATLRSSEVAERMYGETLGADGKRLLAAIREGERKRRELFDAGSRAAALAKLMDRDAALAAEFRALGSQRDEYDRLCRERSRLNGVIRELNSRQAGMQSQLRGHRFMQRIWDPWSQARDCERGLAEIPPIAAFPSDGLQRLHQLEAEIDSESRCRRALLKEVAELETRRDALLPNPAVLKNIAVLRRFAARRDRIEQCVAKREAACQAAAAEHRTLADACAKLGEGWSPERLASVDLSPSAQHDLLQAAGAFQKAIVRRGRFRRAYKVASQSFRKLRAKVEQGRGRFGDQTVAATIEREQQRTARIQERRRLELRAAALRERRDELQRIVACNEQTDLVPAWFRRVLWFFALAGGLVALIGLLTAFTVNAWSGLVLCLAGLTGLGASRGLQLQTAVTVHEHDASRRTQLQAAETQLQQTTATLAAFDPESQEAVAELARVQAGDCQNTGILANSATRTSGNDAARDGSAATHPSGVAARDGSAATHPSGVAARDGSAATHPSRVADASPAERIAALVDRESYYRLRRRLEKRRRRMSQLRHRFAGVKQDFSTARQNWCEALKRAGLDVTLKLDDAFAQAHRVVEAGGAHSRWQAAELSARRAERRYQRLLARMLRAGSGVALAASLPVAPSASGDRPKPVATNADASQILDGWQRRLDELESLRDETQQLNAEIHKRRQEARQYGKRLKKLKRRLAALLVQGGAADREEFEQRAAAASRRAELQELLAMAKDRLAAAAALAPELAVVEEDLETYDAAEHAECIRALDLELADISRDLQHAHEELGSVKQALSELAADDRGTKLRSERSRVESELVVVLEEWLAERAIQQILGAIKSQFERTHQPAVLASASDFLQRFTRGRYPRIWAPLGRCRLFVEDRWDDSWDLDELSGGTREQVFLALRLALVDDYSRRGVELPLVLDDVLVNFDRPRTGAAVETLQQVAAAGRQIIFLTCHEHIAEEFRRLGITPLELPDQPREREQRIAG